MQPHWVSIWRKTKGKVSRNPEKWREAKWYEHFKRVIGKHMAYGYYSQWFFWAARSRMSYVIRQPVCNYYCDWHYLKHIHDCSIRPGIIIINESMSD